MKRYPIYCLLSVFLLTAAVRPADAQIINWVAPSHGDWEDAGNWSPLGLPNAFDLVRIGSFPTADSRTVTLETHQVAAGLEVTNGDRLIIDSGRLDVSSNVVISGEGSFMRIRGLPGGAGDISLSAENLTIGSGAEFALESGRRLLIDEGVSILAGGKLSGRGIVQLNENVGIALSNDGEIETDSGFGGLVINQGGDALIDLDGSIGNGLITIDKGNGFFGQDRLTVNGTQLSDSFSGTIYMEGASILDMNLSGGWTADANSEINIQSNEFTEGFGNIQGGHATLGGTFNYFTSNSGEIDLFRIEADSTILDTATFNIEQDNQLRFVGDTTVLGGTFNTPNAGLADGAVMFYGDTDWNGEVTINGLGIQIGDATVSGATTINAARFDLRSGIINSWDINHSLTINTERIGGNPLNRVDTTLDIGAGISNRLVINLEQPDDFWTLSGVANLGNSLPFQSTRIGGSQMRVQGAINVSGADVRITADTIFLDGSDIDFATAGSSLVMRGETRVEAGAHFTGDGTLINGIDGHMTLADGVSLDDVSLVNRALFEIGDSPGIADVASFESTDDATWFVEIGGYIAGDEFDLLLVSDGDALLAGQLEVSLIDAGFGLFAPAIGDEFTILSALGDVSGAFANDPISFSGGSEYQWEVLYNPHDVTLRVASISNVPEPGSAGLILIVGFGLAMRRKR